jgi:hypothetical protein
MDYPAVVILPIPYQLHFLVAEISVSQTRGTDVDVKSVAPKVGR